VAGGGKSRRFVLAIRSESIALKLKSLVGRLDLEFMIVPGHGHEVIILSKMKYYF